MDNKLKLEKRILPDNTEMIILDYEKGRINAVVHDEKFSEYENLEDLFYDICDSNELNSEMCNWMEVNSQEIYSITLKNEE